MPYRDVELVVVAQRETERERESRATRRCDDFRTASHLFYTLTTSPPEFRPSDYAVQRIVVADKPLRRLYDGHTYKYGHGR